MSNAFFDDISVIFDPNFNYRALLESWRKEVSNKHKTWEGRLTGFHRKTWKTDKNVSNLNLKANNFLAFYPMKARVSAFESLMS